MNTLFAVCAATVFLSAEGQTPTVAVDTSHVTLETLDGAEDGLLADAADGRLDEFFLFDAALIASGAPNAENAAKCRTRFERFRTSVAQAITDEMPVRDRAKELFHGLHKQLLTGQYRAICTELHRTLDDGHYNCVTATILYRSLCKKFGVPIKTIAETGHVYCRLEGDSPTTIQTTTPDGFTASGTPNGGREITDVQLLAKIYYNRGVGLLEQDQFQQAFELLQIASRLDRHDKIAWRNTLACVNNWALSECDAGRFQEAAELLFRGLEMDPHYQPFLDNELHVHHRWVSRLCADGRFKEAMDILESGYERRPDAPLFDDGRLAVYQVWELARRVPRKTDEAVRPSADR